MNEEISIVPLVVGALAVLYFGYEVERRRISCARHSMCSTSRKVRLRGARTDG